MDDSSLALIRPLLVACELPTVLVELILNFTLFEGRYHTIDDFWTIPKNIPLKFMVNVKITKYRSEIAIYNGEIEVTRVPFAYELIVAGTHYASCHVWQLVGGAMLDSHAHPGLKLTISSYNNKN